ncbi:MAG: hypothetical protein K2Q18_07800 [Bdellovibrionales bacterium]|nr:hypothetical protein [Bdellovibrionales bacterium]
MKTTMILSNILFIAAIVTCKYSGNDKAPLVVLAALVLVIIMTFIVLLGRKWKMAVVTATPVFYFIIVLAFARMSMVDPEIFLGFR